MKTAFAMIISLCSTCLLAQNHLSKKDSNFVRHAMEHTLFEIKLAELAQTKAVSPEVKSLAATLHASHIKASADLKQLAASKNISVPSQVGEKGQKYIDKLNKKEGKDFDKAYTKCAIKTHKMGACYLKKESKKAKDADIKSWAASFYPVLEQNKDKAKETCKAIKKQS